MRLATFILLLSFLPAAGAAEVYRSVDENGNVVFSDKPSEGAEKIEVQGVQTVGSPDDKTFRYEPPPEEPAPRYTKVAIASPGDDEAVRQNNGNITVQVAVEPQLRRGDELHLLMDGKDVASGSGTSFPLENVDRGTHTLQARVVGADGRTLATSGSVSFHMLRHSILNKPPPAGPLNPPGSPGPPPPSQ